MTSVSQVEMSLKHILEERANVLARETGCIQRQRKFSGADLLQTLMFGWLIHPAISLEMLASTAATRHVQVTDTAVHKRFSKSCAQFLHAVLEEMTSVIVEADRKVPFELLQRFETVVLEDSSSIALPEDLAERWQGCGGTSAEGQACGKAPCPLRLETRTTLRANADLRTSQRSVFTIPRRCLACWTIFLTDAPADLLSVQEALVLLGERWQMEMLYKLWKQYVQIDEWHTANPWRILCELYAKLIGVLLQHWLIVLFAWQDEQRSLVKLAQVVRDTASSLLEALAGDRSLLSALQCIQRRMGSGCQMNTREKHPNATQLL